ncbi:RHS domain-containing protein [Rothia aeria]|uniref:RHS domain-containing protein n=1 Tax=Rothia aeria TaxID=172042 RepID=UPI0035CFF91A
MHYFHCEHIGIPREMTDKDGNLLWFGGLLRLGQTKERNQSNGYCLPAIPVTEPVCRPRGRTA